MPVTGPSLPARRARDLPSRPAATVYLSVKRPASIGVTFHASRLVSPGARRLSAQVLANAVVPPGGLSSMTHTGRSASARPGCSERREKESIVTATSASGSAPVFLTAMRISDCFARRCRAGNAASVMSTA